MTKPRTKRVRIVGHGDTLDAKEEIQALLREIVILRDGGCILRDEVLQARYGLPGCSGSRKDGTLIHQADHLESRGHAATYADSRLVVCVCKAHHGWKSVGENLRKEQYDAIVRTLLSPDRVALWDRCKAMNQGPTRGHTMYWKLELAALKQELRALQAKQ